MDKAGSLGTSPMMLAYAAAEEGAPNHLVLYRVGEFYEVLSRNAATVSRALESHLTRRLAAAMWGVLATPGFLSDQDSTVPAMHVQEARR